MSFRIINLTGRLALEWADWKEALNKAGESADKFERRVSSSQNKIQKELEALEKQTIRYNNTKTKLEKESADAELKNLDKIAKMREATDNKIKKNKELKESLKERLKEIENAGVVERKFKLASAELDRQLDADSVKRVRETAQNRLTEAKREKASLLKLARQSTKELTDEEQERVKSLTKIRGEIGKSLTEKRREVRLRQDNVLAGEADINLLTSRVLAGDNSKDTLAAIADMTIAQSKRRDALARSQSAVAGLTSDRTNVDKQLYSIKSKPDYANRLAELDAIISKGVDDQVNNHIAAIQDQQKKLLTKYQTEKDNYIKRNSERISQLTKRIDAIPGKSDERDALSGEIKKLETQLDNYKKRKQREIEQVENTINEVESRKNALNNSPALVRGSSGSFSDLSREDKYNLFAERAQSRDAISKGIAFNTAVGVGALIGVIKQGLPVQAAFNKELANTSIKTSEYAKVQNILKASMRETGKGAEELGAGYRKIENILGQSKAMPVYNAALKQAVATYSDFSAGAETAAKVHSIFNIDVSKSSNVVNTLTNAANQSQLEVDDLSKVLGQTAGIAKAVGLGFVETTAAITLFTKKGLSASESATQLRNSISKIYSPSAKVQTLLREFTRDSGVDLTKAFSATELRSKGLAGAFTSLREAAAKLGLRAEDLAFKIFPNLRGTIAGTILASEDGFKTFTSIVKNLDDTFEKGTDFLSEKYKIAINDAKIQTDRLSASSTLAASAIADAFSPQIKTAADFLANLSKNLGNSDRQTRTFYANFATGSIAVAATAVVFYKVASAIDALKAASIAAGGGMKLLAGSVGTFLAITALIAGATYAISRYTESQKSDYQVTVEANNARKEHIQTTIDQAEANFNALESVKPLINKYAELKQKEGDSKKVSEERNTILREIAKISPDLIEYNKRYAGSIDLVTEADDRLRDSMLRTQQVQFAGIRNREQAKIAELEALAKQAKQRKAYLEALAKNPAFPGGASGLAGGVVKVNYAAKLFPEEGLSATEFAISDIRRADATSYIRKKLGSSQKLAEVTQEVDAQNRALMLLKEEFAKNEKILKGLAGQTKKSVNSGLPNPEDGVSPFLMNQVFGDSSQYFEGVKDRLKEESDVIKNKRSEVQTLMSQLEQTFKEKFLLQNGDTKANRAVADRMFEKYKIENFLGTSAGVLGDEPAKISALSGRVSKLRGLYEGLAREVDGLNQKTNKSSAVQKTLTEYNERITALGDVLELSSGKQLTFQQKALAWLKAIGFTPDDKKQSPIDNQTLIGDKRTTELINRATQADLKQVTDKVKRQADDLGALIAELNPQEAEKDASRLRTFFVKNKELAESLNKFSFIPGSNLTEYLIRQQDQVSTLRKTNKFAEELTAEINKRIADNTKPKNDEDRVTADLTGGLYKTLVELEKFLGDKAPNIVAGIKVIAETTRKEKIVNPFKDIDEDITKAKGALESLVSNSGDFTFEAFVMEKFKVSPDGAAEFDKLRELYAFDKTIKQMTAIKSKIDALRKKADDDPIEDIGSGGKRLITLQKEMKQIEKYESRLKSLEGTFKNVFSRAFDSAFLNRGNFVKSLAEGAKDATLRLISQELANGIFDQAKNVVGSRFKPKLSKDSDQILSNPDLFMKTLSDTLFATNKAMNVRIVSDLTSEGIKSQTPVIVDTSGGKANVASQTPTTVSLPQEDNYVTRGESNTSITPKSSSSGRSNTDFTRYAKSAGEAYLYSRSSSGSTAAGLGQLLSMASKDKNIIKMLGGSNAGLLGSAGALLGPIGLGLAINDALGNPLKKAERFFRKNIFRRATYGNVPAGSPIFTMNEKGNRPEVFIPSRSGVISGERDADSISSAGGINIHMAHVEMREPTDATLVASKILTGLSVSRRFRQ